MTKTILNFNGGLDSTYVLWKLLAETQDDVTALTYRFPEKNATLEVAMHDDDVIQEKKIEEVKSVVNWLKTNIRDFTHTIIDYDDTYLDDVTDFGDTHFPKTIEVYVVKYGVQNDYDKIVSSFEKENDGFSYMRYHDIETPKRPAASSAKGVFKKIATKGEISFPLLDMKYHQAYALRELPTTLLNLTKSCDANNGLPCGICFKCSKRKFFIQCIGEGKTNEEIQSVIDENSITPDGKWISMKWWLRDYISTYKGFVAEEDYDTVYNKETQVWPMPIWPTSFKL
jgi:7-cyano-7-deazaguanine synthase in queuosine biosynthesis